MKQFAMCYSSGNKYYGVVIPRDSNIDGRVLNGVALIYQEKLKVGEIYEIEIDKEIKSGVEIKAKVIDKITLDQLVHRTGVEAHIKATSEKQKELDKRETAIEDIIASEYDSLKKVIREEEIGKLKNERAGINLRKTTLDKRESDLNRRDLQVSALEAKASKKFKENEILQIKLSEIQLNLTQREALINDFKQRGGFELLEEVRNARTTSEIAFAPSLADKVELVPLPAQLLKELEQRLVALRYQAESKVIERWLTCFLASILNGQFLLLSGPTGVGKTSLLAKLAEALGITHSVIPVRPAWLEASDLLGYFSSQQERFIPTPFTEVLMAAVEYSRIGKLTMITLDEINLSRIEDYAADLVSQHEKAFSDSSGGHLRLYVSPEKRSLSDSGALPDSGTLTYPSRVPLPNAMVLTGTLNLDHSGDSLSPKVLDRSYVIQIDASPPAALPAFIITPTEKIPPIWTPTRPELMQLLKISMDQPSYKALYRHMELCWITILSWRPHLNTLGLPSSHRSEQAFLSLCHAALLYRQDETEALSKKAVSNAADTYVLTKLLPWLNVPADERRATAFEAWKSACEREKDDFPDTYAVLERLETRAKDNKYFTYLI